MKWSTYKAYRISKRAFNHQFTSHDFIITCSSTYQFFKCAKNLHFNMHFATLLLLAASSLSLATPTPPGPNPNDVFIKTFTYGGSGCPAGTVRNATDSSKTILTLIYDQYIASIGPGTSVSDRRKNCQINLDIHYPQGWQFSLFSVDFRGFKDLEKYVTGKQLATYYFSGTTPQVMAKTTYL